MAETYSYSGFDATQDDDSSERFSEPMSEGERGSTNTQSRSANAAAADTVNDVPEYGRAFPELSYSLGDDDMVNHVYGES